MTICVCAASHDVSSRDVRIVCPRANSLRGVRGGAVGFGTAPQAGLTITDEVTGIFN